MIFRRVLRHVQDQDWTAVAIDFVIVVVGVFLGIQLGSWNQVQADARLGEAYADRLGVDLRRDRAARQQLADYDEAARALRADPAVIEGLRYPFSPLTSAPANIGGDVVWIDRALAAPEGSDEGGAP